MNPERRFFTFEELGPLVEKVPAIKDNGFNFDGLKTGSNIPRYWVWGVVTILICSSRYDCGRGSDLAGATD